MHQIENQIQRSIRHLAQKECANYDSGCCLPEDRPCHVISSVYKTVHDGAVNCDYFLQAVLPLQPELHTAVWHELLREEDQAGESRKECVRCHKPFIPGSNRQRYCTDCGAAAKQARSREKQRRYRERQKTPACPFSTKKVQENQRFPDTPSGQDDRLVVLLPF